MENSQPLHHPGCKCPSAGVSFMIVNQKWQAWWHILVVELQEQRHDGNRGNLNKREVGVFLSLSPFSDVSIPEKQEAPSRRRSKVSTNLWCVLITVCFSFHPGQLSCAFWRSPLCQPALVHSCPIHAIKPFLKDKTRNENGKQTQQGEVQRDNCSVSLHSVSLCLYYFSLWGFCFFLFWLFCSPWAFWASAGVLQMAWI